MGVKILIGALLALVVAAIFVGYSGWTAQSDVEMPVSAYVALGLGTFVTLLVGCGLMALVFYSSRKGYDDAAHGDLGSKDPDVQHWPRPPAP